MALGEKTASPQSLGHREKKVWLITFLLCISKTAPQVLCAMGEIGMETN